MLNKIKIELAILAAIVGFIFCAIYSYAYSPLRQIFVDKYGSYDGGLLMATTQELENVKSISASEGSIILMGASYAKGLKIEKIAGREMINKGIGGEQSFETLARFEREVLVFKPEAIILWGFINDIFCSDRQNIKSTIERIRSSYIEMIEKARTHEIIPIVATEVTMSIRAGFKEWAMSLVGSILGKTSYQEYVNSNVMHVNGWLKEYAKKKDIILLDFQALLADEDGIMRKKEYSHKDGSHISVKGYRIVKEYIQKNLKSLE